MIDSGTSKRGRPRDPTIATRVLQVARDLLVESGFDATTIQAIAARSGVHASAIYRRWPSRAEIIEEAAFSGVGEISVKPTGDLRKDLHRFVRAYTAVFDSPASRAAMPGLLMTYQTSDRSGAPETWLALSARPQFMDILRAAPTGSLDDTTDPDDIFDMLLGALIVRTLIPTVIARNPPISTTVDLTLRLLKPGSP